MPEEPLNVLQILKSELEFIEYGGYGFPNRWEATIFADSPTCLNYGYPYRIEPCPHCPLMQFVPETQRASAMPCHHIPLDSSGRTIEDLEHFGEPEELQAAVKSWLTQTIQHLESQQASSAKTKTPNRLSP